jgi:hypothetical protein
VSGLVGGYLRACVGVSVLHELNVWNSIIEWSKFNKLIDNKMKSQPNDKNYTKSQRNNVTFFTTLSAVSTPCSQAVGVRDI